MNKATFAAGCFWGVEDVFMSTRGVLRTRVGYTGGHTPDPDYRQVCGGETGHAEAVEVEFDPQQVSYRELLDVFWACHDPTTLNRQGPDIGSQYRSAIFHHDENQRQLAESSKRELEQRAVYSRPIVTEIVAGERFYRAEEYHQQYFQKQGISHCPT